MFKKDYQLAMMKTVRVGLVVVWTSFAGLTACQSDELSPSDIAEANGASYYELLRKISPTDAPPVYVYIPDKPRDLQVLDNGTIKIVVNTGLGGAITYLSESNRTENIINNYDLGRQVQMSFYSGPSPFSINGKKPAGGWEHTGWNPVQAGDIFGNWPKTLEFTNDSTQIYVKSVPMQWALNAEPCDCYYESWVSLDGNTVKVRNRFTNQRTDQTFYGAQFQELPAVFANAPFRRIVSYTGDQPFTNAPLSNIGTPSGAIASAYFYSTENWAALLKDDNWGLGIWKAHHPYYAATRVNLPGGKDDKTMSTNYVSPIYLEHLDHNIVYEYEFRLIVGSLEQIRRAAYQLNASVAPYLPDYQFRGSRQHWYLMEGMKDQGWPVGNVWDVKLDREKNELYGPIAFWKAASVPKLYIRAAYQTTAKQARLYWKHHPTEQAFVLKQSTTFDLIADGQYHTYEIDLSKHPEWKNSLSQLMLAPIDRDKGTVGSWVKVQSISYKP